MFTRRFALKFVLTSSVPLLGTRPLYAQDSFVASMTTTDIGLPEHASDAMPVDLNTNGDVLVNAMMDELPSTILYRSGTFERIGSETTETAGIAMNDAGAVAGWAVNDELAKAALIGQDNIVFMPGEYHTGKASALTNEGIVVGEAIIDEEDTEPRPVYWTESTVEILPAISGDSAGSVLAVNTIQQMAGWSDASGEALARHATLWQDSTAVDLGTLGGNYSEARAINETGLIVGASMTMMDQNALEEAGTVAFSWQDGTLTDLGLGQGHSYGIANDVNDVGMVVGVAGLDTPGERGNTTVAILWSVGEVLDLNTITAGLEQLTLVDAVSVNTFGQILCRAIDDAGSARIAVLSVIGN